MYVTLSVSMQNQFTGFGDNNTSAITDMGLYDSTPASTAAANSTSAITDIGLYDSTPASTAAANARASVLTEFAGDDDADGDYDL